MPDFSAITGKKSGVADGKGFFMEMMFVVLRITIMAGKEEELVVETEIYNINIKQTVWKSRF